MGNIELNTIYNEDCLETMKRMSDGFVDCIITDPPYGMEYQSNWRKEKHEKIEGDNTLEWFEDFAVEAFRVLKENTHIYLFCNEYTIPTALPSLQRVGFKTKRLLVWEKNNHTSGDLFGDYANITEYIIFAHKGCRKLNGNRDRNILKYNREDTKWHPTEKPLDLIAYLVKKSTNEGDCVIDPFLGSGTTAVACKSLRRNYIGCEISKYYCDIAKNRLSQEYLF